MIAEEKWIVEDAAISGHIWVFTVVGNAVACGHLFAWVGQVYPKFVVSFGGLEA